MWDKVEKTIARYGLLTPGQRVVVAVSGGADSVALLHVLAVSGRYAVSAAHLDHGFRGAEAEADAEYVRELCGRLGVACVVERQDVPGRGRRQKLSAQQAARAARHEFLRRAAREAGAERIALGHTRDDRAETVLLNLFRGAGPDGMAGFPPGNPPLVRPLYDVMRAETRAYCDAHGLNPRDDSSNARLDYRRNRVRAELLPHLTAYYNEKAGDAVLRMADLVSADNEALEAWAARALGEAAFFRAAGRVHLDALALAELPLAVRRRALRQAVRGVRGHLLDVGLDAVDAVLDHAQADSARPPLDFLLPVAEDGAQVRVRSGRGVVLVERVTPPSEPIPWSHELPAPGSVELPHLNATVCAERVTRHESAARQGGDGPHIWVATFPLHSVTLPLAVRSWRPGDRITRAGRAPDTLTQKLQDVFSDRKLPRAERARVPVLVDGGGAGRVLCVPGFHNAADAIPSGPGAGDGGAGGPYLQVRFERSEPWEWPSAAACG